MIPTGVLKIWQLCALVQTDTVLTNLTQFQWN